jgi:hypothetical protein
MDIVDRILRSRFTTIGYNSIAESNMRKLIGFIPNRIDFGVDNIIDSKDIENFFSSKSYKRDYNISCILDDEILQTIIINMSNVIFDDSSDFIKKAAQIRGFVGLLNSIVYSLNNSDSLIKYNLVFISSIYVSNKVFHLKGGDSLIYSSELVIFLEDDLIKIEKDRYYNTYSDNITSVLREISINKIINENI